MKFSKHTGIRLKVTLAFSFVFTLLSVCLNLYSYRKIRHLIILDNNRYLLARAKSLLDKTEVSPVIIPLPEKFTALKVFARRSDGTRSILFQSPGAVQKIGLPKKTGVSDTLGLRVAYVFNSSDDNPAELMIAVSTASLQATLRYLLLLLLLSTILSVLISGIISFWMARFFLSPIQKIIKTAKKINANKLRERVPVKESNDELQELAETINEMLTRIDKSLQQQQNFFASASHELKTPLAVMRTELEVNLKRTDLSKDVTVLLKSQLDEINRLQNVVQEFLIISQIKADKLKLNPELFDLAEISLKVFNQLTAFAESKAVKLHLTFDPETENFNIRADKEKLRLVLINLLDNAIKYSAAGSDVRAFIGRNKVPNAMGISIENPTRYPSMDISRLTTAFFGENLYSGAGIGLWLCREIIEAHGSPLNLKNEDYRFIADFDIVD